MISGRAFSMIKKRGPIAAASTKQRADTGKIRLYRLASGSASPGQALRQPDQHDKDSSRRLKLTPGSTGTDNTSPERSSGRSFTIPI